MTRPSPELTISDEQLIANFQSSGELADLDELFSRHLSVVRNLAYRMVLSNAEADDITQEVFVKVLRYAHGFRAEAKFSSWLYQITMNTTKAYFRKQKNTPTLREEGLNSLSGQEHLPDQAALHEELDLEIERALNLLSPKLRAAIVLTAIEQLSVKEAATIEACSTATIHWRIHQARKQLKQFLERYLQT